MLVSLLGCDESVAQTWLVIGKLLAQEFPRYLVGFLSGHDDAGLVRHGVSFRSLVGRFILRARSDIVQPFWAKTLFILLHTC